MSERGKPCHTYSMFMFYIFCIRKRETVSHLKYVCVLYFMYQKGGNCMIPTICLCSRFCVHGRENLYHIYSMFMFYILCIRERKNVSYIQYIYILSEKGNTILFLKYDYGLVLYSVLMIYSLCIRNRKTVSYLQYVHDLDFEYQK